MIETILVFAVIGFTLAHLFGPRGSSSESFVDLRMTTDNPLDLPWIASWSPADKVARAGQSCREVYHESGPDGTILSTVDASCEAGMAHTRDGDRIILPQSLPAGSRDETIQHELIHISQRRHPVAWAEFYARSWGYELHEAPPPSLPIGVQAARRSNPDTWATPWPCWQGRYWPVCTYTDMQAPSLRRAATVWWDAQTRTLLQAPPSAWTIFFGRPSQDEHPHEIAAVYLTRESTDTEAARRLLTWWRVRPELRSPN